MPTPITRELLQAVRDGAQDMAEETYFATPLRARAWLKLALAADALDALMARDGTAAVAPAPSEDEALDEGPEDEDLGEDEAPGEDGEDEEAAEEVPLP